MNRREALSTVTVLLGGTIIGAEAFLSGCAGPKRDITSDLLDRDDFALLNDVGEIILPTTTSSPGARSANVGEFMNAIVTDCYTDVEQTIFTDGLTKFRESGFESMDDKAKRDFLLSLEKEAAEYHSTKKPDDPEVHYYSMVKQLTVWGYLSSEVGATKALRHVAVPGRYEGCITLGKGEKAWG